MLHVMWGICNQNALSITASLSRQKVFWTQGNGGQTVRLVACLVDALPKGPLAGKTLWLNGGLSNEPEQRVMILQMQPVTAEGF